MGDQPKTNFNGPVPPGWNDPPMLNYSPQNPPPKSRITNKRVAFPLAPSATSPSTEGQFPKTTPMSLLPPLVPQLLPTSELCNETLFAKASTNFNKLIEKIDNDAIKDQLNQMLHDWQTGKFTENLQNTLSELSACLLDNNANGVKDIYSKLNESTDENLLVKPYLSALRHLDTV